MKQNHLKTIFLSVLIIASLSVNAKTSNDSIRLKKTAHMSYQGYQGGMMLHIGYAQNYGTSVPIQMRGVAYGIGGAIRVKFGKYLRVGTEGYVTSLKYDNKRSYSKIGWGGILLDSHWQIKKWTLFVGGSIGGGGYSHINMIERPNTDDILDENNIQYSKYPFMVIDPFFGAEYAITKRIGLVLKLDFLFNATTHAFNEDFTTGPRFFFGIMFGH